MDSLSHFFNCACRRFIFLSSHFAAHMEKLEERNADYAKVVRCLRFDNTSAPIMLREDAAEQDTVVC